MFLCGQALSLTHWAGPHPPFQVSSVPHARVCNSSGARTWSAVRFLHSIVGFAPLRPPPSFTSRPIDRPSEPTRTTDRQTGRQTPESKNRDQLAPILVFAPSACTSLSATSTQAKYRQPHNERTFALVLALCLRAPPSICDQNKKLSNTLRAHTSSACVHHLRLRPKQKPIIRQGQHLVSPQQSSSNGSI